MTTALEIINDALAEIGVLGAGSTASAEDAALGLRYLNRLVQRWSNSPLMVPVVQQLSVPLTGAQSYTIGPSGANVTAARPLTVVDAYSVDSAGLRYRCDVVGRQQWNAIGDPNTSGGPPEFVYYERSVTTGRLYVHPRAPSAYTLKIDVLTLLTSYSLSTSVTLPEGYESALVLSLAEDISGVFNRPANGDLKMRAKGARHVVKRTNTEPLLLTIDGDGEEYRIERGY